MTQRQKTSTLQALLRSPDLTFLLEAHNGLSAKIAEEAGFQAIWASGLSISAALGVRDSNEASWTQVLEVAEFMADATSIPILLDGDTGYGNFNSMRRLVAKLEQRGIAGVCIEDKVFPKSNSFINGTQQPLAEINEFCGKIRAGKAAQRDDNFVIVARVEALIAGMGLVEALKRAEAYRLAGADAILIHSAKSTATEILAFKKEWGARLPIVIVPTKYYTTPTEIFREHGFSLCIWANHLMRSALTSMQVIARQIFEDQNLFTAEDRVAPLAEVFRLQGASELEAAEEQYLPRRARGTRAIVLAASRGAELGELTLEKPKCMVDAAGRPLLAHIADAYGAAGVKDITVVRGYCKQTVDLPGLSYVDNDAYATTQEVGSLMTAVGALDGPAVISYGDVIFKKYILLQLLDCSADFVVAVDANWSESHNRGRFADYVMCSAPSSRESAGEKAMLRTFVNDAEVVGINGEWMGFLRVSARGAAVLKALLEGQDAAVVNQLRLPDVIEQLVKAGHGVEVIYTVGHWLDVDSVADVVRAGRF